jgi:ABC-type phosphate/phosphonate transport system substrate-binding protein
MLATTAPSPCDAIAHRPGLASGMIERLAKTLTEVAPDDEEARDVLGKIFHTSGMMRADLRNYDPVREAMQRVTKLS